MSWWEWTILGIYLIGIIPVWRRVGWYMAEETKSPFLGMNSLDWIMVTAMSLMVAAFWPLVVPIALIGRYAKHGFFKPPKSIEKEIELEEQRKRIEELEYNIRQLDRERRRQEALK